MNYEIRSHIAKSVSVNEGSFREIPGFTDYKVSRDGRVYSCKSKRELKSHVRPNGYVATCLSDAGQQVHMYVHRLVAMAWLPNPDKLPEVNHKNHDRADNRVENLEWCTSQYNNSDPGKSQRRAHGKSAVTGYVCGIPACWFNSMAAAASFVCVDDSAIRRCCDGELKTVGEMNGHRLSWKRASYNEGCRMEPVCRALVNLVNVTSSFTGGCQQVAKAPATSPTAARLQDMLNATMVDY